MLITVIKYGLLALVLFYTVVLFVGARHYSNRKAR